jgi:hypothetical protein
MRFNSSSFLIEQRTMNPHLPARVQLRMGPAGIGLLEQTFHGCLEGSIPRETDTLVLPQAVPVELRNVAQPVVAAGMATTGEVPRADRRRKTLMREDVSSAAESVVRSAIDWRWNKRVRAWRDGSGASIGCCWAVLVRLDHIVGGWRINWMIRISGGKPYALGADAIPVAGVDPNDVSGGQRLDRWINRAPYTVNTDPYRPRRWSSITGRLRSRQRKV